MKFRDLEWIDRRSLSWQYRGPTAMAMALQPPGGALIVPDYPSAVSGGGPFHSFVVLDADGEAMACIFQAPATGTITGFGVTTHTLTTGDANVDFRLEGVDLSATPAKPSGALIAAGANAAVNVAAGGTTYTCVLGTPYAATKGELLAAVVIRKAGGSLNTGFRFFGPETVFSAEFPLLTANLGGAGYAAQNGSPCFAINYGGTYYQIRGLWPFIQIFTQTYNNTSTPDVHGNLWIPRFKCRVTGVWLWIDLDGPALIKFYDTNGVTVLATANAPANQRGTTAARLHFLPFNTTVTPTVGSTYRIGIEPSSGTSLSAYYFSVASAAILDAYGLGQNFYRTSSKDPSGVGSWTDVTTERLYMGLMLDQFDDGVGGGILSKSLIAGGA